jgi:hypothetical protein
MAEEGNLGTARALAQDRDATSADLGTRIDESRESTAETIGEDAAINQRRADLESVTDVLDWRGQVRKHPIAWSLGALGLGIFVGYSLIEVIDRGDEIHDYASTDDMTPPVIQYEGGGPSAFTENHSYATHAHAVSRVDNEQTSSESERPGLYGRFKETRAYDRLQEEVGDLGNRFMDELSNAARTIVLPALFNKLKELIGIDLSNEREVNNSAHRQTPVGDSTLGAHQHTHDQDQGSADSILDEIGRSESGKPVYPATSESSNKFDQLENVTPSTVVQVDPSPHINLNYDDRYERESKLFSRGESRGFAPERPAENRQAEASTSTPHGGDYTYEPGHSPDEANG